MQGQVIHVAMEGSEGFIRAEDSLRYPYEISDWISLEPASVGASVDFELVENRATQVCEVPPNVTAGSNQSLPIWKKKWFLAAAGALALLTIGTGVVYNSGMFAGLASDPHGPIKNYQAINLAKIRNMPTAQGSVVLGELNAGDRLVGRVYIAPDGQSQWIKREGVEEYVSIINLAEVPTPHVAPAQAAIEPATQSESGFSGLWKNDQHRSLLTISKAGDAFVFDAKTDELGNMLNGSFSGTPRGGALETGTFLGNMVMTDNGQILVFAGMRFYRTSEEGERKYVADQQAAAEAQQQAAQAQEVARNKAALDNQINSDAHAYVYNCETRRGDGDEYYYCGLLDRFRKEHADKVAIAEAAIQRCLNQHPGNPNAACLHYQIDWSR